MIDLKDLRADPDKYRRGAAEKQTHADIEGLLDLDAQVRAAQTELQHLVAKKNQASKQIGPLMGRLKKAPDDEKQALLAQVDGLKQQAEQNKTREAELNEAVRDLEARREAIWLSVPQPADPDVPVGTSSDDNIELRTWHAEGGFDPSKSFEENRGFKPKSHIQLGEALGLFDFERGVKMAGSRSYILTGDGMRLHNAILQYAFNFMVNDHGFKAMSVPVLVKEDCMVGTGFFPGGRDQAYTVSDLDKRLETLALDLGANSIGVAEVYKSVEGYLTGTGEVGLMGLHQDE
ncbi:MAG: hypothetical protein AAGH88_16340, partial [Planctomycetota bacterium]